MKTRDLILALYDGDARCDMGEVNFRIPRTAKVPTNTTVHDLLLTALVERFGPIVECDRCGFHVTEVEATTRCRELSDRSHVLDNLCPTCVENE